MLQLLTLRSAAPQETDGDEDSNDDIQSGSLEYDNESEKLERSDLRRQSEATSETGAAS
jgi:hypothetical protein